MAKKADELLGDGSCGGDEFYEKCIYFISDSFSYGQCRFNAPVFPKSQDDLGNPVCVWARVKENDWCGQYNPIEKA